MPYRKDGQPNEVPGVCECDGARASQEQVCAKANKEHVENAQGRGSRAEVIDLGS